MSSDPVQLYQSKLRAKKDAEAMAEEMVFRVRSFSDRLKDWKRTVVSNMPGVYPASLTFNRSTPSIDGNTWPTAQQVNEALGMYHTAVSELMSAWTAIPEERKEGLMPPT